MAESLNIPQNATKEDVYKGIIPQIKSLIEGEENLISNLANVSAVLDMAFKHLWTGFYLMDGNILVLGPFQGPIACTRIPVRPIARGVCGVAAESGETQLVPDVDKFSGHIACASDSRSEIVVPLVGSDGATKLVLDIDSLQLNCFDKIDQKYCEKIVQIIKKQHF
ncbi:MAG: hypothetical protein COB14_02945 [Alphaproteobacteria bacterium]|nr:MAG: hypothetical protein COB14_02945 [Alphaproteobacteria bacterium]